VRLSPAKPRAGSTVVASVRVTRSGAAILPRNVACAAAIGGTKVNGPEGGQGVASCLLRTPRNARGKRLAGVVCFRADGRAFRKRFTVRLS
jgi:hypothetical protein